MDEKALGSVLGGRMVELGHERARSLPAMAHNFPLTPQIISMSAIPSRNDLSARPIRRWSKSLSSVGGSTTPPDSWSSYQDSPFPLPPDTPFSPDTPAFPQLSATNNGNKNGSGSVHSSEMADTFFNEERELYSPLDPAKVFLRKRSLEASNSLGVDSIRSPLLENASSRASFGGLPSSGLPLYSSSPHSRDGGGVSSNDSLDDLEVTGNSIAAMRISRGRSVDNKRCLSQIEPLYGVPEDVREGVELSRAPDGVVPALNRSVSQSTPSIDSSGKDEPKAKAGNGVEGKKTSKPSGMAAWQMMSARPTPALLSSSTSTKSLRPSLRLPDPESKKIKRSGSSFFSSLSSFRKTNKPKQAKPHFWVQASVSNSTRCEVCNKALARSQSPARQCNNCDIFVHDHCKGHVSNCSKFNAKHPHDAAMRSKGSFIPMSTNGSSKDIPGQKCMTVSVEATSPTWSEAGFDGGRYPLDATHPHPHPHPHHPPLPEEDFFDAEEDLESQSSLRPSRSFPSLNDPSWDDLELWMVEPESWSQTYKNLCKKLKSKEVKRQDVIYELFRTEKHHCQTLAVLKRTYREMLLKKRLLRNKELDILIPDVLDELLHFHLELLRKLKDIKTQSVEVDVHLILPMLIEHFRSESSERAVDAYVKFCSGKNEANDLYHELSHRNSQFLDLMETVYANPKYKERKLLDCLLLITQRLTKYPVLVEQIQKNTDNLEDNENAALAVKEFASKVDQGVQKEEVRKAWNGIAKALDPTVSSVFEGEPFTVADMSNIKEPIYITDVFWQKAVGKPSAVKLVLFPDRMVFLEQNGSKYAFFSQDRKSAVIGLRHLLIREKATKPKGIFLIVTTPSKAELYDITADRKSRHAELFRTLSEAAKNAPAKAVRSSVSSDDGRESEQLNLLLDELHRIFAERESAEQKINEFFDLRRIWYEDFCRRIQPLIKGTGNRFVEKTLGILTEEFEKMALGRQAAFLDYVKKVEVLLAGTVEDGVKTGGIEEAGSQIDIRRVTTFHGQEDLRTRKKSLPRRHTALPNLILSELESIPVSGGEGKGKGEKNEEGEEGGKAVGWDASSRDAVASVINTIRDLRAANASLEAQLTEKKMELESWKHFSRHSSEVQRQVTLEKLRQSQGELQERQIKFQQMKEDHERAVQEREKRLRDREDALQAKENTLQQQIANFSSFRARHSCYDDSDMMMDSTPPPKQQNTASPSPVQLAAPLAQSRLSYSPLPSSDAMQKSGTTPALLSLDRQVAPPRERTSSPKTQPKNPVRIAPSDSTISDALRKQSSLAEKTLSTAPPRKLERQSSTSPGAGSRGSSQRKESKLGLPLQLAAENPKKSSQKKKKK